MCILVNISSESYTLSTECGQFKARRFPSRSINFIGGTFTFPWLSITRTCPIAWIRTRYYINYSVLLNPRTWRVSIWYYSQRSRLNRKRLMLDTLSLADKNGYFVVEPVENIFQNGTAVSWTRKKKRKKEEVHIDIRVTNEISITPPYREAPKRMVLICSTFSIASFRSSFPPLYSPNSWNISKTT